jgi:hypothetical protein
LVRVFLLAFAIGTLAGCGTLPNGRGWGQDATFSPGWKRVGEAAVGAALDPHTWVPAAGASVFLIGDWDEELSDWASEHTPLFGSQEGADNASDYLTGAAVGAYVLTALATPSGEQARGWTSAKMKGVGVGAAASILTYGATGLLKEAVGRDRPDGSDDRGFPSARTSNAAVFEALAARNLRSLALSGGSNTALRIGFTALSVGTAWSRLEARKHFPTDVLAGAALGNFLGAFINDAFLGLERSGNLAVAIELSGERTVVRVYRAF